MRRLILITALILLCLSLLPTAVRGQCPDTKITSMHPKEGPVGTRVEYIGMLDTIDSPYQIFWDSSEDGPVLDEGTSVQYAIDGSFIVPEAAYGKHKILLFNARTLLAPCWTQDFKITPAFTLNPDSASPGTQVKLSGSGFPAEEEIEITFAGTAITKVTSDELGTIVTAIAIPVTHSGNHTIKATNAKLKSADIPEASFKVIPGISVNNTAPAIGAEVKVLGKGFAPQSEITIKYDDNVVPPKEEEPVITDESGSFKATIVIPFSTKSTHTLTAVDASGGTAAGNMGTMILELEKEPPDKPMPLRPINERFGVFGSKVVAFEWTDVEDPSGVSYNLEIGKDLTFFPPQRKKTKLEESGYVLTPAEALPMGTYYWRVQAVDGAGNKSEWSVSPYPIKIGLIPLWAIIICGIVVLLIALYILRAALRFIVSFFKY